MSAASGTGADLEGTDSRAVDVANHQESQQHEDHAEPHLDLRTETDAQSKLGLDGSDGSPASSIVSHFQPISPLPHQDVVNRRSRVPSKDPGPVAGNTIEHAQMSSPMSFCGGSSPASLIDRSPPGQRFSRSTSVVRSSLFISHAAASSSPEKGSNERGRRESGMGEEATSWLTLPPRRPIKQSTTGSSPPCTSRYKQTSATYRLFPSQANDSKSLEKGTAQPSTRLSDLSPSSFQEVIENPREIENLIRRGLPTSEPSTPSNHVLDDYNRRGRRPSIISPDLPTLPPPFSARPRNVSDASSVPSSSSLGSTAGPSRYAFFPDWHLPSLATRPQAMTQLPPDVTLRKISPQPGSYEPSLSPPTPKTPQRTVMVYNDALPAASQPQTPVGLPRHGVLPMSMIGSFTAPVGQASRRRGRMQGQPTHSPTTRGGRRNVWRQLSQDIGAEGAEDQENNGVAEANVMQRARDAAAALRAGPGELERTPPREERLHRHVRS